MARHAERQRDAAYRVYLTDCLYYMGKQQRIDVRYYDVVHNIPVSDKSGDEIVEDIIDRYGLKRGDG